MREEREGKRENWREYIYKSICIYIIRIIRIFQRIVPFTHVFLRM